MGEAERKKRYVGNQMRQRIVWLGDLAYTLFSLPPKPLALSPDFLQGSTMSCFFHFGLDPLLQIRIRGFGDENESDFLTIVFTSAYF